MVIDSFKVATHLDPVVSRTRQSLTQVLNRAPSQPVRPNASRSTTSGTVGFSIRMGSVVGRAKDAPCWSTTWVRVVLSAGIRASLYFLLPVSSSLGFFYSIPQSSHALPLIYPTDPIDTGNKFTPQAYDISNIQAFTQSVSIGANGCQSTTCTSVKCPCTQAYPPGVSTTTPHATFKASFFGHFLPRFILIATVFIGSLRMWE